jgi:hypothetical protein
LATTTPAPTASSRPQATAQAGSGVCALLSFETAGKLLGTAAPTAKYKPNDPDVDPACQLTGENAFAILTLQLSSAAKDILLTESAAWSEIRRFKAPGVKALSQPPDHSQLIAFPEDHRFVLHLLLTPPNQISRQTAGDALAEAARELPGSGLWIDAEQRSDGWTDLMPS